MVFKQIIVKAINCLTYLFVHYLFFVAGLRELRDLGVKKSARILTITPLLRARIGHPSTSTSTSTLALCTSTSTK